jgi:hypothetical protein
MAPKGIFDFHTCNLTDRTDIEGKKVSLVSNFFSGAEGITIFRNGSQVKGSTISSLRRVKYRLYLAFISKEVSSIEHKIRTIYHILFLNQSNICDDRSRMPSCLFFDVWNFNTRLCQDNLYTRHRGCTCTRYVQ